MKTNFLSREKKKLFAVKQLLTNKGCTENFAVINLISDRTLLAIDDLLSNVSSNAFFNKFLISI